MFANLSKKLLASLLVTSITGSAVANPREVSSELRVDQSMGRVLKGRVEMMISEKGSSCAAANLLSVSPWTLKYYMNVPSTYNVAALATLSTMTNAQFSDALLLPGNPGDTCAVKETCKESLCARTLLVNNTRKGADIIVRTSVPTEAASFLRVIATKEDEYRASVAIKAEGNFVVGPKQGVQNDESN